jgi:hypothetical protein
MLRRRLQIDEARGFAWGFASQGASSATNLLLTIFAGRLLGPSALGSIFLGFTYYVLALGFQRSLISDPLLTSTSSVPPELRGGPTRAALTMVLLWGSAATILMALTGYAVPRWGRGFVLFIPWLLPALVQDFWRAVLFRDHRGRGGAGNDAIWLLVMGVTAPLMVVAPTRWAIVGNWGLGALVAAVVGFLQVRVVPKDPLTSVGWWKMRAWPLARWLGAESVVYTLSSQFLILILADVVGTRSLGGLRAVGTMFAPLTLITPALVLPGLPAVARAVSAGRTCTSPKRSYRCRGDHFRRLLSRDRSLVAG